MSCQDPGQSFISTLFSAVLWELVENTELVIGWFRENSGPSEEYRGDSRVNVVGDVVRTAQCREVECIIGVQVSCALGYSAAYLSHRYTASLLPSLAWLAGTELGLGLTIRDNIGLMSLQVSVLFSSPLSSRPSGFVAMT